MQCFMTINAQRKSKKKIFRTSGSGYPLSSSKKLTSTYETSIHSTSEKVKAKVTLNTSKLIGLFFKKKKKIVRFSLPPLKKKKNAKNTLNNFVPLVNAKSTTNDHQKQRRIPVFTPEVPHSHNNIEKVIVASFRRTDHSLLSMSLDFSNQKTATELARRVFDQDHSVYPDLEHVVEWIGDGKPFSNMILIAYMDLYDFSNEKLEKSFRMLCSRLHLKGETQQIDRVLLQFATRYYYCNPSCVFGTADIVHAIVYSILLLNTDLHVAEGDYKRMSRSAFVKNTMDAIQVQINPPADHSNEVQLNGGYSFQSLEWIPLQRTSSNQSTYSSRSSSYSTSFEFSRLGSTTATASFGTKIWYNEMKGILKQMYSNIRNHQIATPSTPTSCTSSGRVSAVFKRSIGNIMFKGGGTQDLVVSSTNQVEASSPISCPISPVSTVSTQKTPRESFSRRASISSAHSSISSSFVHYQTLGSHLQNTELPAVYTSNSPYYKEGMVVRKHLLEKTNQKAKHRDWKECFMVIDRSQLRMYKLGGHKRNLIRNSLHINRTILSDTASQISESSSESINVGGGDWMANAQLIGSIDLRHTLTNMLPSGYSPQRQHVLALQQSNGAVYLFQAGSAEQVQEWVSTCNYWAARESKEPLTGGVSSMEYGWGSCLDSKNANESIHIHEWQAPVAPTVSSMLEEAAQLETLIKHVKAITAELDRHRELKSKMECYFYNHKTAAAKAMMNWEKKSQYLLHEIIKYQNYCAAIEKSLVFQSKIMSF